MKVLTIIVGVIIACTAATALGVLFGVAMVAWAVHRLTKSAQRSTR